MHTFGTYIKAETNAYVKYAPGYLKANFYLKNITLMNTLALKDLNLNVIFAGHGE